MAPNWDAHLSRLQLHAKHEKTLGVTSRGLAILQYSPCNVVGGFYSSVRKKHKLKIAIENGHL